MDKVSIIIPIYNVEKYLKECIESVINQTYKNIEIILVDDGSPDNCGKICDEYINKDERIKVIHKVNGGLSDARNVGMDISTGKYLMFLDSDDTYEPNACELLYNEISSKDADYVVGNYRNMDEDGTKWDHTAFDRERFKRFKLEIDDHKDSFFVMNNMSCNKMFSKKFIYDLNHRFVVGIPSEDLVFVTYCYIKATKVYFINDIILNYRQRKNSISTTISYEYFKGNNKAYRLVYENCKKNKKMGFYRYNYAKSMTYILYKFIDSTILTREERIELLQDMRWLFKLSYDIKVPACQESLRLVIDSIIDENYEQAVNYCTILRETRSYIPEQIRCEMSKPTKEFYNSMSRNDSEYENK